MRSLERLWRTRHIRPHPRKGNSDRCSSHQQTTPGGNNRDDREDALGTIFHTTRKRCARWQSPEIYKDWTWIWCGVKSAPRTTEPFDES